MKKIITIAVAMLLLGGLLFFIDAEQIIESIGVRNAYVIAFIVSLFGGLSVGGSASFIGVLTAFALAGLNPYYLAILGGLGLSVSDLTIFYLGKTGRQLLTGHWSERVNRLTAYIHDRPGLYSCIPVFVYTYLAFLPLPNDIPMLSVAAIDYPWKKIIVPVIAGACTFTFILITVTTTGISLFGI